MDNDWHAPAVVIERDFVPIFTVTSDSPRQLDEFCGTGFVIADGLLITCWHCVSADLSADRQYAAVLKDSEDAAGYSAFVLTEVEQDGNGTDLATARVDLTPTVGQTLYCGSDLGNGADVWTHGFPLTDAFRQPDGSTSFVLNSRFLQGYITRSFYYDHPGFGTVPSFELDMLTPAGLSGAPLLLVGSATVVGVVYGTIEAMNITQETSVDPDTGESTPATYRVVPFGLAHHTTTLRAVVGAATDGRSLEEVVPTSE